MITTRRSELETLRYRRLMDAGLCTACGKPKDEAERKMWRCEPCRRKASAATMKSQLKRKEAAANG